MLRSKIFVLSWSHWAPCYVWQSWSCCLWTIITSQHSLISPSSLSPASTVSIFIRILGTAPANSNLSSRWISYYLWWMFVVNQFIQWLLKESIPQSISPVCRGKTGTKSGCNQTPQTDTTLLLSQSKSESKVWVKDLDLEWLYTVVHHLPPTKTFFRHQKLQVSKF